MNWDDLRILIAIRDEGSYARAGTRLRIDETTIARRLSRLEASLGMKLFDAIDGMRMPTTQCRSVLEHADEVARRVAAIDSIAPDGPGITGRVRLATTASIADEVLAPRTATLLRDNPGLTLQFLSSGRNVNFSRWEADVAVRLRRPPKGDFTITKLAKMRLYYFEPVQEWSDTGGPLVCCYPDDLDQTPESLFLGRKGQKDGARLVTESLATIRQLLQSHSAIGILPEYACASLLEDRKLRAVQLPQERDVWLLVQTHLKRDPAARLVIKWIREAVRKTVE